MTDKSKKIGGGNIKGKGRVEPEIAGGEERREKRRNDKAWRMIENHQKQLSETARWANSERERELVRELKSE